MFYDVFTNWHVNQQYQCHRIADYSPITGLPNVFVNIVAPDAQLKTEVLHHMSKVQSSHYVIQDRNIALNLIWETAWVLHENFQSWK